MSENQFIKPVERIIDGGRVYLDQRLEQLKLNTVQGLSVGTTALSRLLLIFAVGSILLLTLSFAFVMWLGEILNSYALAAFIVAGVLLIVLVVLYLFREKLFTNSFVSLYSDIMRPQEKATTLEQLDKSLETVEKHIDEQEVLLKGRLSQAQQYYSPSHLINEGLRIAGESAGRATYGVASWVPTLWRMFVGRKKKKKTTA